MDKVEKARVFKNGRSQAVRIPAQYHFKSDEVYIRCNPNTGELTMSERPLIPSFDEIYANLDAARSADFVVNRDPAPPIERESLRSNSPSTFLNQ
jgi:antitoxin VapB